MCDGFLKPENKDFLIMKYIREQITIFNFTKIHTDEQKKSYLGQGADMAWSHQGDGYTDFICKRGSGQGGFNFYISAGNGSNFEVGKTFSNT